MFAPVPSNAGDRVEAIRRFNRFYTRRIGLLHDGLLRRPFSLAEARVVFELAQRNRTTASSLCTELGLDPGYMSRIATALQQRRLVARKTAPDDGRQALLSLTAAGRREFARLNDASAAAITRMIATLTPADQELLVQAMGTIAAILDAPAQGESAFSLRAHQPGDMGWVVERHAVLYHEEYGWDARFEALVADIVANFLRNFDERLERCWIAEKDGARAGCVFLVKHPERAGVAKLRLLLTEPFARGIGIGGRLVSECTRFARQCGYHTLTLWTNSVLVDARRLYEREGYRLAQEEAHHSFGHDLVAQIWELSLGES